MKERMGKLKFLSLIVVEMQFLLIHLMKSLLILGSPLKQEIWRRLRPFWIGLNLIMKLRLIGDP